MLKISHGGKGQGVLSQEFKKLRRILASKKKSKKSQKTKKTKKKWKLTEEKIVDEDFNDQTDH